MNHGYLLIQRGAQAGTSIPLQLGQNLIGRDDDCEVVIPDAGVSRRHAALTVNADGAFIADLGSANGTVLNGVQITDAVWLKANDVIQLGQDVQLVYQQSLQVSSTPLVASAKPPKKKRGCLAWGGIFLAIILCCLLSLLALGGVGYYMYTTGQVTPMQLMNMVGVGEVSVANLTDETLAIELIQLETESGEPSSFERLGLAEFDVDSIGAIPPGSYQLTLESESGQPGNINCYLTIKRGDVYQIVGVPEGFAISLKGYEADSSTELDMRTTSLCQP